MAQQLEICEMEPIFFKQSDFFVFLGKTTLKKKFKP